MHQAANMGVCPVFFPREKALVRRKQKGMTMVEVMIAAVLLAFGIMSALTMLSSSYASTRHARMVSLASQIVQSKMEDLRLCNYTTLQGYASQTQPVDFSNIINTERFASNFTKGFTLTGNFTTLQASATGQLGFMSAMLTVQWGERSGSFTRSMYTRFSEKGLSDYVYVGWAP